MYRSMMIAINRSIFRRYSTTTSTTKEHSLDSSCLPHANCWNCKKLLDCTNEKFFCASCTNIQPPVKCANYFQYLNQPIAYDLDFKSLSMDFKNLQRRLHPDRFTQRSSMEQDFSAEQSSLVNKAYATLTNPLSRALYLLRLHGKPLMEKTEAPTDPRLLVEMMELNERLADTESMDEIRKYQANTKSTLEKLRKDISTAFGDGDLDRAREIVIKMKFHASLEQKINSKLGLG